MATWCLRGPQLAMCGYLQTVVIQMNLEDSSKFDKHDLV